MFILCATAPVVLGESATHMILGFLHSPGAEGGASVVETIVFQTVVLEIAHAKAIFIEILNPLSRKGHSGPSKELTPQWSGEVGTSPAGRRDSHCLVTLCAVRMDVSAVRPGGMRGLLSRVYLCGSLFISGMSNNICISCCCRGD